MIYVVGSGPAGIAAADALLRRGQDVTMIDGGVELEPDRRLVVSQLQSEKKWPETLLSKLKENTNANTGGIPKKLVYGSEFPYRDPELFAATPGVEIYSSLARGGLSNVWGAAVLPYTANDIHDWPISYEELQPYYRNALSLMPIAAQEDRLIENFPLFQKATLAPKQSKQAAQLFANLESNAESLAKKQICFGHSRLAVNFLHCTYCKMCLYGCPLGLIYSADQGIQRLLREPKFTYFPDFVVERFQENASGVLVTAINRLNSESKIFSGERVYFACGALSSTKIFLQSLGKFGEKLTLKCSQHFVLPLLQFKRTKEAATESQHTLAQLFIEIFGVSNRSVHLQIYAYNELYQKALQQKFGAIYSIFKKPIDTFLLQRLLIAQGYFHSDDSDTVTISLENKNSDLKLSAVSNPRKSLIAEKVTRLLHSSKAEMKAFTISSMLKLSDAGGGAHSGGTFPMKKNPQGLESDILGRPAGLKRVHFVDSSVLPSLGAQTITLTVMANAYRIASHSFES